jgi:hypothetical protein
LTDLSLICSAGKAAKVPKPTSRHNLLPNQDHRRIIRFTTEALWSAPLVDPITGTTPKNPSGNINARARMRGRVPRLARHNHGRSDKRPGPPRSLVPADSDCARSCAASCATGDWNVPHLSLLRSCRHYAAGVALQFHVRALVQMIPTEPLRSSRLMRLRDQEVLGQWVRRHSLQAFAYRAACQREQGRGDRMSSCPRMSLWR